MHKVKVLILAVVLSLALSGCANGPELVEGVHTRSTLKNSEYMAAQLAAIEAQKPTFELEAQEGQTIILSGVKAIRVYGSQNVTEIKPYVSPGYALARDLTQMLVFPLTGLAMFSQALGTVGQEVVPFERSAVDPFERTPVDPFARPVTP
jgi:hypothetical protein